MKFRFLLRLREFGIALAILAASGAPIFAQGGAAKNSPPSSAAAHVETVVVFPFENVASDGQKDWLGEGLSELTTDSMVGTRTGGFHARRTAGSVGKIGAADVFAIQPRDDD